MMRWLEHHYAKSRVAKSIPLDFCFQLCAISFYLIVGTSYLGVKRHLFQFPLLIIFGIAVEQTFQYIVYRKFRSILSVWITATSLFLLLETRSLQVFFVAMFAASASKYFIKHKGSHVFNPACFGVILVTSLLSHKVASTPAQWGADNWLILLVFIIGLMTSFYAKRIPLVASYWCSFVALSLLRSWLTGNHVLYFSGVAMGMAGVIFYCHMLTDPRTTPFRIRDQILFGSTVAILDVVMKMLSIVYAPFVALAITSALVPIVRSLGFFPFEFTKSPFNVKIHKTL